MPFRYTHHLPELDPEIRQSILSKTQNTYVYRWLKDPSIEKESTLKAFQRPTTKSTCSIVQKTNVRGTRSVVSSHAAINWPGEGPRTSFSPSNPLATVLFSAKRNGKLQVHHLSIPHTILRRMTP